MFSLAHRDGLGVSALCGFGRKLEPIQPGIYTVVREQLFVTALLDDAAFVKDNDLDRLPESSTAGAQSQAPCGLSSPRRALLQPRFGIGINARCRFVEDQDGGLTVDRPRKRNQLSLTRRKFDPRSSTIACRPPRRSIISSAPMRTSAAWARSGSGLASPIAMLDSTVPWNKKTSCGTTAN